MKNKKERKALEGKLLSGIKKVILDNKSVLTNKTEKSIKKTLKQIAKKTFRDKQIPSIKTNRKGQPIHNL